MVTLNKKKRFIIVAKEVIDLEIKALIKLKNNINESFNLAVQQILKCQSKVILCGVGKSGLIANKIPQHYHRLVLQLFILQLTTHLMGT